MQGYFYPAVEGSVSNIFKRKASGDGNPFRGIEGYPSGFLRVVRVYPPHNRTIM